MTLSLHAKSIAEPEVSNRVIYSEAAKTQFLQSKGTPHEINYQGWLGSATDTTGVTGTLNMTFRLFSVPTGGTALWSETQNGVKVDKGIFNVLLESVYPIPSSIFTGNPLWLQIQVGSDTLSPRKKLVSVGYAIKSELADSATYADTASYAFTTTAYAQVFTVALSGGDFTTINAALTACGSAGQANPYLIRVMPGHYGENITMIPFVRLQGAGKYVTYIEGSVDGADSAAIGRISSLPPKNLWI